MNIIFEQVAGETQVIISALEEGAKHFKLPKKTEISVAVLNDDEIKELNARTRAVNEITDVLSFPFVEISGGKVRLKDCARDVNPQTKCVMLGEICINLKRANEQAESYCHDRQREYAYLALHGFLHIMGFDHQTEQDKEKMRGMEEKILSKINLTR